MQLAKVNRLALNCRYTKPRVKYKFDLDLALAANRPECEVIFGKLSDMDFQKIYLLRDALSPPRDYQEWKKGLLTWDEVREKVEEVRELLNNLGF